MQSFKKNQVYTIELSHHMLYTHLTFEKFKFDILSVIKNWQRKTPALRNLKLAIQIRQMKIKSRNKIDK